MRHKTQIMETVLNDSSCDPKLDTSSLEKANMDDPISSEEAKIGEEKKLDKNVLASNELGTLHEIDKAVISQKAQAEPLFTFHDLAVNTTREEEKANASCNGNLVQSNDLLMIGSKIYDSSTLEKEVQEITEMIDKDEQNAENTPSFKLGFNNNAHKEENMSLQNIEDENMGRMIYNNREPLSMIMEGNSPVTEVAPVAEVAPIIIVNHKNDNVHIESSKSDEIKKSQMSTKQKPSRTSLKSEIILPSKSKIPQGIRGIKAMPGSNRLYLTGLKKSSSLNSPLSTADLSPRTQTFSERNDSCSEQYNNISEMSGASTPMSNLIDAADIRSKLK